MSHLWQVHLARPRTIRATVPQLPAFLVLSVHDNITNLFVHCPLCTIKSYNFVLHYFIIHFSSFTYYPLFWPIMFMKKGSESDQTYMKSVALWSANIRKKCPRTIRATVPQLEGKILYNVVGCICSVIVAII
jgi:hypothetical protein